MEEKQFNERVNDRLAALLARVEGVKRGSDIARPVLFDAQGEQHANEVARRDAQDADLRVQDRLPSRQGNSG